MNPDELQQRVRTFALRVMKMVDSMPNTLSGRDLGRQLLRSATSVSANYRAARRARSRREFLAKIALVSEEADESEHWLDLIMAYGILPVRKLQPLHVESTELLKIFAATRRSARRSQSPNHQIAKSPNRTSSPLEINR